MRHAVARALLTSALGLGRMRSSAGVPSGLELDLWIVAVALARRGAVSDAKAIANVMLAFRARCRYATPL